MDTTRFRLASFSIFLLVLAASATGRGADRPDVVIADFEGDDYGGWSVEGEAFGKAPARGALPGQMEVSGFLGRGLASSFVGGDDSAGVLKSPPFTIERPFLNVLIGGGSYPGETCANLVIAGTTVRSTTGPNDRPGGTERLDWQSWNVGDLLGKTATVEIVDRRKGGWGHVSVDQIVQSDRSRGPQRASREIAVTSRYLHLPVQTHAPGRRIKLTKGESPVAEFDIKLAEGRPDFLVACDVGASRGSTLHVEASLPAGSTALASITQSDDFPDEGRLYREPNRPGFHFTSRRGWLNDPNGLVWRDGEYHLFYQHNPYGWEWGNMHWGHAVSPDLVHWSELGEALTPRTYGDWCFSGSAVVDAKNTSGWARDGKPALVVAFTSTGRGECIAFSHDGGRTFVEFAGNPVVKHVGRDPKLVWHAPTNRWVMAVYDEAGGKQSIAFYSSPDLKTWAYESRIEGFFECPDLFAIPLQGDPAESVWVLYGADGKYLLGSFDGHTFTPRPDAKKHQLWYGNFYAAQTFSDTPDGRRVQIGWATGSAFPGMPFNQQMTVPVELTLRPTADGPRLFANPVESLAGLSHGEKRIERSPLGAARALLPEVAPDGFEIELVPLVSGPNTLTLDVRGTPIVYDPGKATLLVGKVSAPLPRSSLPIDLRILVDRGSIEVFAAQGAVAVSVAVVPPEQNRTLAIGAKNDGAEVASMSFRTLNSAWPGTARPAAPAP